MLSFIIFIILTIATVSSEQISGVFTSFDSLVWEKAADYPFAGPSYPSWIVKLSWRINGNDMNAGDTFTLDLPCVFKFTTNQASVNLNVGKTNYATCAFNPGDIVVAFSKLECVLLDTVTSSTNAHGSINFPVAFNVGGSALSTDLESSTCFVDGRNTVSFYDGDNQLSTQVSFSGGATDDPNKIVYRNRVVPSLNKQQHYLLAGNCRARYKSGSIGMKIQNQGSKINCDSIHMAITNSLNDWYLPKNANNDFKFTYTCTSTSFMVEYKNIPAGYRPFIDSLFDVANGVSVSVNYVNNYICADSTKTTDNSKSINWSAYENNVVGGNGEEVEVVTSTYTGSTTQISTMPFQTSKDKTMTIVVNVPIPTVTTTTTYVGISTSYTTITAPPGSTASVIEFEPVYTTTTITTCWVGEEATFTTTYSTSTWATVTEAIVTPCPSPSASEESTFSEDLLTEVSSTTNDPSTTEDPVSSEEFTDTQSLYSSNESTNILESSTVEHATSDEFTSIVTLPITESSNTESFSSTEDETNTEEIITMEELTTTEVFTYTESQTSEESSESQNYSSSENISTSESSSYEDPFSSSDELTATEETIFSEVSSSVEVLPSTAYSSYSNTTFTSESHSSSDWFSTSTDSTFNYPSRTSQSSSDVTKELSTSEEVSTTQETSFNESSQTTEELTFISEETLTIDPTLSIENLTSHTSYSTSEDLETRSPNETDPVTEETTQDSTYIFVSSSSEDPLSNNSISTSENPSSSETTTVSEDLTSAESPSSTESPSLTEKATTENFSSEDPSTTIEAFISSLATEYESTETLSESNYPTTRVEKSSSTEISLESEVSIESTYIGESSIVTSFVDSTSTTGYLSSSDQSSVSEDIWFSEVSAADEPSIPKPIVTSSENSQFEDLTAEQNLSSTSPSSSTKTIQSTFITSTLPLIPLATTPSVASVQQFSSQEQPTIKPSPDLKQTETEKVEPETSTMIHTTITSLDTTFTTEIASVIENTTVNNENKSSDVSNRAATTTSNIPSESNVGAAEENGSNGTTGDEFIGTTMSISQWLTVSSSNPVVEIANGATTWGVPITFLILINCLL